MKVTEGWRIPPRRVVLWHAVSALPLAIVVALGGYLSYHYHALSMQSRERVDRAYEVLVGVNSLFVAVEDADVAQRDFVITGRADSLTAFQAALRATDSRNGRLHDLLLDSRPQLDRLARLELAIAEKVEELGQTVAVRQAQGFAAARDLIAQRSDKALMDRVRAEAKNLVEAERTLLSERQEVGRAHERNVLLTGIGIAGLSVCIRFFVAWFLARLRKSAGTPGTAPVVANPTPRANEARRST